MAKEVSLIKAFRALDERIENLLKEHNIGRGGVASETAGIAIAKGVIPWGIAKAMRLAQARIENSEQITGQQEQEAMGAIQEAHKEIDRWLASEWARRK